MHDLKTIFEWYLMHKLDDFMKTMIKLHFFHIGYDDDCVSTLLKRNFVSFKDEWSKGGDNVIPLMFLGLENWSTRNLLMVKTYE